MPLMRRGPGLVGTAARAGVAMGVAGRVQHRQQQRWAAQEQEAAYQQQPAYQQQVPAEPAQAAEPDYTAELERLAKLRDEGIISAEDFEAKKKQLLGI
jgi:membrane protease subunit (stomatin/prohibitin family)